MYKEDLSKIVYPKYLISDGTVWGDGKSSRTNAKRRQLFLFCLSWFNANIGYNKICIQSGKGGGG